MWLKVSGAEAYMMGEKLIDNGYKTLDRASITNTRWKMMRWKMQNWKAKLFSTEAENLMAHNTKEHSSTTDCQYSWMINSFVKYRTQLSARTWFYASTIQCKTLRCKTLSSLQGNEKKTRSKMDNRGEPIQTAILGFQLANGLHRSPISLFELAFPPVSFLHPVFFSFLSS